jgi:hypothetical protein
LSISLIILFFLISSGFSGFGLLRGWWPRARHKLGWGSKGLRFLGQKSPTILDIFSQGAVILEGWHRETPEGLLGQRCAHKKLEFIPSSISIATDSCNGKVPKLSEFVPLSAFMAFLSQKKM